MPLNVDPQKNRIHWVAGFGSKNDLLKLIAAGEDPSELDADGCTLIFDALLANIPVLVHAGADINKRGKYGRTALHWAAVFSPPEIILALIDNGADHSLRNCSYETALDLALFWEKTSNVNVLTLKRTLESTKVRRNKVFLKRLIFTGGGCWQVKKYDPCFREESTGHNLLLRVRE